MTAFAAFDDHARFLGTVDGHDADRALLAARDEHDGTASVRQVLNVFTLGEDLTRCPPEAFADPDCTLVLAEYWLTH